MTGLLRGMAASLDIEYPYLKVFILISLRYYYFSFTRFFLVDRPLVILIPGRRRERAGVNPLTLLVVLLRPPKPFASLIRYGD